jgi:hypothetical protein
MVLDREDSPVMDRWLTCWLGYTWVLGYERERRDRKDRLEELRLREQERLEHEWILEYSEIRLAVRYSGELNTVEQQLRPDPEFKIQLVRALMLHYINSDSDFFFVYRRLIAWQEAMEKTCGLHFIQFKHFHRHWHY